MISSFNKEIFDLTGQMNAVVLNKINAVDDNHIKVHIPKIMPNISGGEPRISITQTKGYSVFKNANKRPAISGSVIREKNYFETKINAVSNIDDLNIITEKIIKEINESLKEFANKNDLYNIERNKKLKYEIQKYTNIRVEFLNGKLDKLAFTLMDQTDSEKDLE